MTSRIFQKLSILIFLSGTFGQRTDNCTNKRQTPCGNNKCCCTYNAAICRGFGSALTYIPPLQQHISHFTFEGNSLPILSKTSFSNISAKNIIDMSLAINSIWNISADAFCDFVNLTKLHLNENKLTILSVRPFQSLKHLSTIQLSNNRIRHIANDAIQSSVRQIRLTNNLLAGEFYQDWFCSSDGEPVFPRLNYIDISNHCLNKLTSYSFKCLGRLTHLGLYRNSIHVIQPNAFVNLRSLKWLKFSQNNIKIFPKLAKSIFKNNANIHFLDISHNSLSHLSSDQFLEMLFPLKRLTQLHASSCHLSTLPVNFLSTFGNLTDLCLDSNLINTLEYFRNVYSLKKLSLKGNAFNGIHEYEVSDNFMNSLNIVNLANNPFDCTCELLWFRSMINDDTGKFGNITLLEWPSRYACRTPLKFKYAELISYKPRKLSCTNVLEIAFISLGAVLVMSSIMTTLSYRYRWYIRYLFYKLKTNHKSPETRPLLDPEHQAYDGYVIYHTEDSQFVHHDLRLFMEEKHGYKLHIWERDVPAGFSTLEAIVDGIHASEHAIAVISGNSIQDSWIKFQMDVALDRQIELEKEFLILVILEDVDFKTLSKYWCVMLTRLNAARWCRDETDVKQAVFEQQITNHFRGSKQRSVQ